LGWPVVRASAGERRHVQDVPHGTPSAADHSATAQGTTVAVEGRDADQGGNLPAVEVAQFGQVGNEPQHGDRTHAGDRPQLSVSRHAGLARIVSWRVGLEIL
jgi:hypothetical protein